MQAKTVGISEADTLKGHLEDKLLAASGISLTKGNTGADETLTADVTGITDNVYLPACVDNTAGIVWKYNAAVSRYQPLIHDYGTQNLVFGKNSGNFTWTGTYNLIFGNEAGNGITSGGENLLFGYSSGSQLRDGSSNVFVGTGAGGSIDSGSYNICIGAGTGAGLENSDSYKLIIGDNFGVPIIYGEADTGYVSIAGAFGVDSPTLYVDNINHLCGFGLTTPEAKVHSLSFQTVDVCYIAEKRSTDTAGPQFSYKKARLSGTDLAAVTAGDVLFNIGGFGYDGVGYSASAAVSFKGVAAETFVNGAGHGAYLTMNVAAIGATSQSERIRILGSGAVGIATTAPDKQLEINHATGGCLRLTYNDSNGSATTKTDFDVDSSGELTITSPTAKTPVFTPVAYEDLQVSINNIAKGVSAPTDRTYAHGVGSGIAYPVLGFAKGNYIWFDVQTSHSMKLNTVLDCHIHFVLPNTTTIGHKIVWQLDVLYADINGTWTVPNGSPFTATHTVAANDDTKHRVLEIADIPAVNTGVSTVYKCKLTRIDGTATEYASEVYLEFVDCHYQRDTIGSRQETVK